MQRHFSTSEELIAHIAMQQDEVLLSFSRGKDSIGAWLALRPHFRKVSAFYLEPIPGLEFVEESLRYFEQFFGTRIVRFPHPSFYRQLRNLVFQPPERCGIIEDAELDCPSLDACAREVKRELGLPRDTWVAIGARTNDNWIRRASLKRFGSLNPTRRTFMPVYDWDVERLTACLRASGVKLPIDYRLFGRSWDGIQGEYLSAIREHLPRDYARILEWFPVAELEIRRVEWRKRYV
jgi:hypothetical protein